MLQKLIIGGIFFASGMQTYGQSKDPPLISAPPIIADNELIIQNFDISLYGNWPFRLNGAPIKVFALEKRIILVWPEAVINLDAHGNHDALTLITLFASRQKPWSPEAGTLSFDGIWYGFLPNGSYYSLNLETAAVRQEPWLHPLPQSIHPAFHSSIVIENRGLFEIVQFPLQTGSDIRQDSAKTFGSPAPSVSFLGKSLTPITQAAASGKSETIAWLNAGGKNINIISHKAHSALSIQPGAFALSFAMNETLILGYSNKLLVIEKPFSKAPKEINSTQIPREWYSLHGGPNRLILKSPSRNYLTLISRPAFRIDTVSADAREFAELIRNYAQSAREKLMHDSGPKVTEKFLAWLLVHVRILRSLTPLDSTWPEMEEVLSSMRRELRQSLQ